MENRIVSIIFRFCWVKEVQAECLEVLPATNFKIFSLN